MNGETLLVGNATPGQFCRSPIISGSPRQVAEKPPVEGFNYNSVILTEVVTNPAVAYPLATITALSTFTFSVRSSIAGLWLATSIINPAAVPVGVFVGKINRQKTVIDLTKAANLYFQHISQSLNTISRTGGMSFGEQSGLIMNTDEQFGVYVSGSDAGISIMYALSIAWITMD